MDLNDTCYKHKQVITVLWVFFHIGTATIVSSGQEPSPWPDRQAFDRMDRALNDGNGFKTSLGGVLAWGESYIMLAYVEMYQATKDTVYLDKLVDHANHVLNQRDDRRGFRDWSGRSRPVWSVGDQYTVAELTLVDAEGRDTLRFRSTKYAYNQLTQIKVVVRPEDQRMDLVIENGRYKTREEYRNLNFDRISPDFIERRVNTCSWIALGRKAACNEKGSELVTVEAVGIGLPVKDKNGHSLDDRPIPLVPLVMAYHGYSGLMLYPMLDFAWLVHQDPALRSKYGRQADMFVEEAVRVCRDADEEWRDGPQVGEGYYVNGERGCPFWCDNIGKAFNYQCASGRAMIRLFQLTGDPHWRSRIEAIGRLFKRHLRTDNQGAYVWNYWWGIAESGWTRENSPSYNTPTYKGFPRIEDSSHGHLEVDFACLSAEVGMIFEEKEVKRFVATLLHNVVDRDRWTVNNHVDGTGGRGLHDAIIGGWCGLAIWEPEVARVIARVAEKQKLAERQTGAAMWTMARLVKWGTRLGPTSRATSWPLSRPN